MISRITFTPTVTEQRFINKYMKAHGSEKAQDVLRTALKMLEKDELIQTHNRAIHRHTTELDTVSGDAEPSEEETTEAQNRPETVSELELRATSGSYEEEA